MRGDLLLRVCSCPWCANLAVEGMESFAGEPTCEEHDFGTVSEKIEALFRETAEDARSEDLRSR